MSHEYLMIIILSFILGTWFAGLLPIRFRTLERSWMVMWDFAQNIKIVCRQYIDRYIRSKCYLHRKKARGLCPILCEMDLGNSMSYMILQIAWFSVINPLENKMALRKTADKDGLLLCSHHFFFNFTMYPSLAFFKNKGPFQAGAFFIRPLGMLTMVENGSASLFS